MSQLSAIIAENTAILDFRLQQLELPSRTFNPDASGEALPRDPEIEKRRQNILEATDELQALTLGPPEFFFSQSVCSDLNEKLSLPPHGSLGLRSAGLGDL